MDKVEFLKAFVSDTLSGVDRSYNEYAQEFMSEMELQNSSNPPEKIRGLYRKFRKTWAKKGLWESGEPIEQEWLPKVELFLQIKNGDKVDTSKYRVTKIYEQQSKDGEIVQLKSYSLKGEENDLEEMIEDCVDQFLEVAANYIPSPVIITRDRGDGYSMNLYTADKHVGSHTYRSMFGNNYNMEIYTKRTQEWFNVIMENKKNFGTFNTLQFIDLGDTADGAGGYTTSKTHSLPQEVDDITHYECFLKTHIDFFDSLLREKVAEKIVYVAATNSNHGGYTDYMWAKSLEIYLNQKYPQVETIVEKDFLFHNTVGHHNFIFTHGKPSADYGMKRGFPINLDAKTEDFIEMYINYHGLNKGMSVQEELIYNHLIKGDLHMTKEEYGKRFRYKNIMSVMGSTDFIEYNYSKGWGYKGFEWDIFKDTGPYMTSGKFFYSNK